MILFDEKAAQNKEPLIQGTTYANGRIFPIIGKLEADGETYTFDYSCYDVKTRLPHT